MWMNIDRGVRGRRARPSCVLGFVLRCAIAILAIDHLGTLVEVVVSGRDIEAAINPDRRS